MTDDDTSRLLARIANAIDRIEHVAASNSAKNSTVTNGALETLSQQHSALKDETQATIASLDDLLAKLGGES